MQMAKDLENINNSPIALEPALFNYSWCLFSTLFQSLYVFEGLWSVAVCFFFNFSYNTVYIIDKEDFGVLQFDNLSLFPCVLFIIFGERNFYLIYYMYFK